MSRIKRNVRGRVSRRHRPEAQVAYSKRWSAWTLPALAAALTFANTVRSTFVYDDAWKAQTFDGTAPSLESLLRMNRGLTHALHWLDHWLWGAWAPGYHLTNVALHALAAALAAVLALALTRSRRVGLLGGLLFALHPVHVEAVASFANRKDILAMIFVALAMIAWVGKDRSVLRYGAALICFALGLMSKEVAVVALVGMFFLADLLPGEDDERPISKRLPRALLRILPFAAGGLLVAWRLGARASAKLTESFSPESIRELTENQLSSYSQVLANTAAAVADNLRLLVFPLKLSADYPLSPDMTLTSPKALLGLALVIAWIIGAVLLSRRAPVVGLAMAWPLVMLLPLVNLIPLTTFFVADRYLYVPSFGICLLAAWALDRGMASKRSPNRRQAAILATLVLLVAGAARCIVRNNDWQSSEDLWSSSLRQGISTWRVHSGLATAVAKQGRYDEAIEHFKRSLNLLPSRVETWRSLAGSLQQTGRTDEALAAARTILEYAPHDAYSHYLLGTAAFQKGDRRTAYEHYQQAVRREPQNPGMLTSMAWLLATSPEDDLRNPDEALRLAERARQLVDGQSSDVLFTLAEAHARRGDLNEALRWSRVAREQAREEGSDVMLRQIELALRRYEAEQVKRGGISPH